MKVNADTRWKFNDLQTVILENEYLKLVLLPEAGGKIYSIYDKKQQVELLWHNPRILPRKSGNSLGFDDQWSGGWDEIFPNDLPVVFKGEGLPDHGELWNINWDSTILNCDKEEVRVRLEAAAPIHAVYVTRELVLMEGAKGFSIDYKIHNMGYEEIEYFWRLHPAFKVEEGSRLHIPGGMVCCDKEFNNPVCSEGVYQWPFMPIVDGEQRDMSCIPSFASQETVFQYIHLREGWFALMHPGRRTGVRIEFDKEFFPYITYFASFGGWRGHNVVVVEPSTGYPADLVQASQEGRTNRLASQQTVRFTVEVSLIHEEAC